MLHVIYPKGTDVKITLVSEESYVGWNAILQTNCFHVANMKRHQRFQCGNHFVFSIFNCLSIRINCIFVPFTRATFLFNYNFMVVSHIYLFFHKKNFERPSKAKEHERTGLACKYSNSFWSVLFCSFYVLRFLRALQLNSIQTISD